MKIQVLGPGCPNCFALETMVKKAVEELGVEAEIEHVSDIDKMVEMGMMLSPGLAVEEIKKWLS